MRRLDQILQPRVRQLLVTVWHGIRFLDSESPWPSIAFASAVASKAIFDVILLRTGTQVVCTENYKIVA
eukprot:SAG22_NODE_241_length_14126_cov_9.747202_3_plen_69_part_00